MELCHPASQHPTEVSRKSLVATFITLRLLTTEMRTSCFQLVRPDDTYVPAVITVESGIVPEEYLATLNEAERALLWREWLTRDIRTYIADLDGKIVGFISGGAIREPVLTYDAEFYAIYLLQSTQRQGIGTALLKELAGSLLSGGFKSMIVWVLEKNPWKDFYAKSSAQVVTTKDIQIGGITLSEVSYGWPDLEAITSPK